MKKVFLAIVLVLLCAVSCLAKSSTDECFAVSMGQGKGDALRELKAVLPNYAVADDDLHGTITVTYPTSNELNVNERKNQHYMKQCFYSQDDQFANKINRCVDFFSCDCRADMKAIIAKKYGQPILEGIYTEKGEKVSERKFYGLNIQERNELMLKNDWEYRAYWEKGNEFVLIEYFDGTTYVIRGWRAVYKNTNSNNDCVDLRYLTVQQ